MLIGYMRVSSSDDRQVSDVQLDALLAAGVDERHLHQDKQSGGRDDRAGLKTCLAGLRAGDVLVVWKLDRLGRGARQQAGFPALRDGGRIGTRAVRADPVRREQGLILQRLAEEALGGLQI